jgi:hypothetical protein
VFAVKERDLPPGWESKLDRNGKVSKKCQSVDFSYPQNDMHFAFFTAALEII